MPCPQFTPNLRGFKPCESQTITGRGECLVSRPELSQRNHSGCSGQRRRGQGSTQVVVDTFTKAKKALSAAQLAYTVGTLEQLELPNKSGALAEFTAKLAKKGMNIDTAYGTVPKGARKSVLFFATSKLGGAERGVPPISS